jgi:hypothetical protein
MRGANPLNPKPPKALKPYTLHPTPYILPTPEKSTKTLSPTQVSDTNPAPGQIAEGAGRLNLKTSEYFIGYEEAHNLWKGMDRSEVVGTIVTHTAPKGCFAALLVKILGRSDSALLGAVLLDELN